MGDKKKKQRTIPVIVAPKEGNLRQENIGDVCTDYMKIFGANNNLMRHIPSIVDGVKPGERRILVTLAVDMKSRPDKKKLKVATIAGNVLKYHPHGDASVMDSLVKLGQPWANILPLIEGEGNYGSPMGDAAGSGRYIEGRLSLYAWKCFFENYSEKLVDMKMIYSGDGWEPEYLPAIYPNVLTNTTFGIGYGASCGLPTYNFNEVIDLTLKLMDDPDHPNVTLYPDSPTGADIVDEGQFKVLSEQGNGKFKMRGIIEVDEENNILRIRAVPMQTGSDDIIADIVMLGKEDKIVGIKKINHKSRMDEKTLEAVIDIELFLKNEIDPYIVREAIFKKTNMEKTFPVNFKLIDDYQDFDYNIRSLLLHWIEFRRETIRREYNYKLVEAKERQHILDTILMIVEGTQAEKALKKIRESDTKAETIEFLMKTFNISSLQARSIAEMRIHAFNKEGIKKIKKEKEEIDKEVEKCNKMIRSVKKIDKIIKEQLTEGKALFGEPRRSKIISIDGSDAIRETRHVIVFTYNGLVKKLPADTQNIGFINPGDRPIEIITINNTSDLLIFDQTGKISRLPIHTMTNSELDGPGDDLKKYCTVNGEIRTIMVKPTDEALSAMKETVYLMMVTSNGIIKKTQASSYVNIKNELSALQIKDGDQLQTVKLMAGDRDLLIYTNRGFGIRFKSNEVRETNRMSVGVKGVDLTDGERVIGMEIINPKDKAIFVLTTKGNGKKCTLDNFRPMTRADKPLRITNMEANEEVALIRTVKGQETFRVFLSSSTEEIKIDDVLELPRLGKGRKLIPVAKGNNIIDIKEVKITKS